VMAVFWLGVYVFVNLTAILWLGSLAISTITGIDMVYGMLFLALFSVVYSLYGGLRVVALTDIIQVVLLIAGGLFLSYITLDLIGNGAGVLAGFAKLQAEAPEKFTMILQAESPHYADLPGLSVLIGGLWIMNLSYWGFNQYIIQRALGARSLAEAQKGIVFAAFLKILMPVIVVLPGIAAVVLLPELERADQAYPQLMMMMPSGLKGLVFAALVAAIVSSVASMSNSIATIFTMDIYQSIAPERSQRHNVFVGRLVSLIALMIALVTAKPLMGQIDQAFQYIQEFTGFFTPGIVVLFLLGMFWPRATANGALAAAVSSAVISLLFKLLWPELPFIDRVGLVFILCLFIGAVVSLQGRQPQTEQASYPVSFQTSASFNLSSLMVCLIVAAFYLTWW